MLWSDRRQHEREALVDAESLRELRLFRVIWPILIAAAAVALFVILT
ncbi:hypothetical protein [Mangrovactinospora gilvigrisea]|nr:hypothetical protein [Mangrovactinospora gilvigrisea]